MKKLLFASILLLFTLQACYDDYKTDYLYSTAYFPFQFPVRTVEVTGDEISFELGVSLGGKYTNERNEVIGYVVEPGLMDSVVVVDSTLNLALLPSDYYTVSNESEMVIKNGEFRGGVTFTLDRDKFLDDTLSHTNHYAVPLRIVSHTTDSVLVHKDYVIAIVKYINEYEGYYWLKGSDKQMDREGNIVTTFSYSEDDLILNRAALLSTEGRNEVKASYVGSNLSDVDNLYEMHMTINNDGKVFLGAQDGSIINSVSGGGVYSASDNNIVLDYRYSDAFGNTHQVNDTLIYRNTELAFTTWASNPPAPVE